MFIEDEGENLAEEIRPSTEGIRVELGIPVVNAQPECMIQDIVRGANKGKTIPAGSSTMRP